MGCSTFVSFLLSFIVITIIITIIVNTIVNITIDLHRRRLYCCCSRNALLVCRSIIIFLTSPCPVEDGARGWEGVRGTHSTYSSSTLVFSCSSVTRFLLCAIDVPVVVVVGAAFRRTPVVKTTQ